MKPVLAVLLGLAIFVAAAHADEPDPPGRVGRISLLQGDVVYRNTATGAVERAALNWPIASGAALETGPQARVEVRIGSSTIRVDGDSTLEFAAIDDQRTELQLKDGAINVRVKNRDVLAGFAVEMPYGRGTLIDAGRYRFDHGRVPDTTALTADQGAARIETADGAIIVRSGRRAEITGQGALRVAEALHDGFDDWSLARDQRDDRIVHTDRYVSPETTGYEDLDEYGDWRDVPDYGPVWVPRAVPSDWAPYRAGRWAWVDPWGWTWVDYAPWGFAPFHYGRWVIVGGVWAWAPGAFVVYPMYAPALVAWIGYPGWSISVAIGSVPAVGWFPLGPREAYYPGYRCSPRYLHNVNVTHVANISHVVHARPPVHYVHRHAPRAVTVAPMQVVTTGRPVAPAAIALRDRREILAAPLSTVSPAPNIAPPRSSAPPHREPPRRAPEQSRVTVREAVPPAAPAPRAAAPRVEAPRTLAAPRPMPSHAIATPQLAPQIAPQPAPPRMAPAPQPAPPPVMMPPIRPSTPRVDERGHAGTFKQAPPRAALPPAEPARIEQPQSQSRGQGWAHRPGGEMRGESRGDPRGDMRGGSPARR